MLKRCELPNSFQGRVLFFFPITYFTFGCPGSCCCSHFSVVQRAGPTLVAVGRLIAVASLGIEHRLQGRRASAVEAPGLQRTGPVVVAYQLQLLCSLWDLPRWEMEPMCPSLACRLCTTEPPGKPQGRVFNVSVREGAAGQVISSCTIFSLVGIQVKF